LCEISISLPSSLGRTALSPVTAHAILAEYAALLTPTMPEKGRPALAAIIKDINGSDARTVTETYL
jgi:hypothetical protein